MSEKEIDEIVLEVFNGVSFEFQDFVMNEIPESRSLFQTVGLEPKTLLSYSIVADNYFKFVDKGVNALQGNYTAKRPKVSGSPYSFRQPSVSRNFATALQDKYRVGVPESYAIGWSIKIHGIVPKNLIDRFFTKDKLEAVANELMEKLKLPLLLELSR